SARAGGGVRRGAAIAQVRVRNAGPGRRRVDDAANGRLRCCTCRKLLLALLPMTAGRGGLGRRRNGAAPVCSGRLDRMVVLGVSGPGLAIATMGGLPPYDSRVALGWTALALAAVPIW